MRTHFSLAALLVALLALAPASLAQDGTGNAAAASLSSATVCEGTLVDFDSDPSGSPAQPFTSDDSPGVSFSSAGDHPSLFLDSGTLYARSSGSDVTSAMQMDFVNPTNSLSLDFGNDDPCCHGGTFPDAILTLFSSGSQVGQVTVTPNFNDFVDQTISYSGAAFDQAIFEFERQAGNNLAEQIDNVCFDSGVTPPDIDIAVNTFTTNPMRGESVFFRGPVTNNGAATEFVYVYTEMDVPGLGTFKRNIGGKDLAAGETFAYKNFPKSKNFFPLTNDAPSGTYTVRVYAASDRFGTVIYDQDSFQFTLDPLSPCAGGCLSASLPTGASLEIAAPHAAPNPFRDATEIRYALAADAEVDLRVYDVTGREVAALVSGTQSAGTHAATLRAGDLPGGVYVWRLAIGGEVTTGRVTLTR